MHRPPAFTVQTDVLSQTPTWQSIVGRGPGTRSCACGSAAQSPQGVAQHVMSLTLHGCQANSRTAGKGDGATSLSQQSVVDHNRRHVPAVRNPSLASSTTATDAIVPNIITTPTAGSTVGDAIATGSAAARRSVSEAHSAGGR